MKFWLTLIQICDLESQRNWKILNDEYHARGERTVSQTAKEISHIN